MHRISTIEYGTPPVGEFVVPIAAVCSLEPFHDAIAHQRSRHVNGEIGIDMRRPTGPSEQHEPYPTQTATGSSELPLPQRSESAFCRTIFDPFTSRRCTQ